MNNNPVNRIEEDEIDLLALFNKLKNFWYIILIVSLLGGVLGGIYGKFLQTPEYTSSAMVYIRSSSGTAISLTDLQLSSALTSDYQIIFTSRPNLEGVINTLGLDMNYEELASKITITNPDKSHILKVIAKADNPNLARDIANSLADYGMDSIREIDAQEPYVVERAIANPRKTSTSAAKLALIGAAAGFVASAGVISVRYIISDVVESVEDIESTFGLPVLAVVMEDKSLYYAKKQSKKKGNKK